MKGLLTLIYTLIGSSPSPTPIRPEIFIQFVGSFGLIESAPESKCVKDLVVWINDCKKNPNSNCQPSLAFFGADLTQQTQLSVQIAPGEEQQNVQRELTADEGQIRQVLKYVSEDQRSVLSKDEFTAFFNGNLLSVESQHQEFSPERFATQSQCTYLKR